MKLSRRLGEIPSAERASLLKQVPIFADVDKQYLDLIADYMEQRNFAPGATLCRQGEESKEVYLIVQGDATLEVDRNGQSDVLGRVGPGDCVGEMGVLGNQPRSATVVAGQNGLEALVLCGNDLREVLLSQPTIGVQLLRIFSRRIAENNQS